MMALVDYDSEGEGEGGSTGMAEKPVARTKTVKTAPVVPLSISELHNQSSLALTVQDRSSGGGKRELIHTHNVPFEELSRPRQGPQNPFMPGQLEGQNLLTGHVQVEAMNDYHFKAEHRTFETLGYARDPSTRGQQDDGMGPRYTGDFDKALRNNGLSLGEIRTDREVTRDIKKRRMGRGTVGSYEGQNAFAGPWAGYVGDGVLGAPNDEPQGDAEDPAETDGTLVGPVLAADPALAYVENEEDGSDEFELEYLPPRTKRVIGAGDGAKAEVQLGLFGTEKSHFHGKDFYDYQGRSYMHIPSDISGINLRAEDEIGPEGGCFLPKRCIHTWAGHQKPVASIKLFPKSGHLLLSAGMDNKIKLWDVYNGGNYGGKCLRTFLGHVKALRDIDFNATGKRFLSASYDRWIKQWDTETGQCISAYQTASVPSVVKYHPDEDKNTFLTGQGNKKILQYDLRSGEITQEYNAHLGSINTLTWVDDNRRFLSTSDDKTMRAWDFGIPVTIKYIADPSMHALPAVTLHPNSKSGPCWRRAEYKNSR